MATISFGAQNAARSVTQEGGYGQKAGLLSPHMVKATLTPAINTDGAGTGATKVLRVLPSYSCDTWEVFVVLGANDPKVRIFGLDDDYAGSGVPASGTKHELNLKDIGPYNLGFVATDMPQAFIVDQAWKGLQFDVTDVSENNNASVTIKVKAYRSGQCTFEGSYTTGTVEAS
tara:strand:- start:655 stop:1173 length:519 start_codon:yes stop_codon:yes gene_type:complete